MMRRKLYIPPPVTEENRDQYFEELSKISEAESWVEKHSVQDNTNQDEIRIYSNDNSSNEKIVIGTSIAIVWLIVALGIGFFCVPALVVIYLFG